MKKLICPECKNDVDLAIAAGGAEIKKDVMLECPTCGISLVVTGVSADGIIAVEIADEGK